MNNYTFLFGILMWIFLVLFSGIPENFKNLIIWISIFVLIVCSIVYLLRKNLEKMKQSKGTFVDSESVREVVLNSNLEKNEKI